MSKPSAVALDTALQPYAPHALGVLRIVTALLFIAHGTQKLFNFPASDAAVELSPCSALPVFWKSSAACWYCSASSLVPQPSS